MKNSLAKYLVFFSIMLTTMTALAQTSTITGTIKDNTGMPIPGANVLIKNTTTGIQTDFDGKFAIKAKPEDILVVSFIGMKTTEIKVGSQKTINIKLEEEGAKLEEVVVVGYGTRKKKDLTGSIVSVGAEEIASRPVQNAVQAMQGKAAGVDISSNERPGTVGSINIRGSRSISASNSPLYVVDGIPLNSGGIDFINPNDIESIDVLKDASATAIYGSRGANGVIIVSTKKGKNGKYTLNYDTAVSTDKIHEFAPLMNAGEYIELRRWAKYYSNPSGFPAGNAPTIANDKDIFLATADPAAWANIEKGWSKDSTGKDVWDGSKVSTTNWTKFVTQTGVTKQHTLSVSGGTETMKAYGSFGYLDNTGTLKGQSYKRYNGIANVDITPTKWFQMGINLNASYGLNEYGLSNVGRSAVASSDGIYITARQNLPYAVPLDANGQRIQNPGGDSTIRNVYQEYKYSQDQRLTLKIFGSIYSQLDFGGFSKALEGLKYRINFGPDLTSYRNGVYLDGLSSARSGTSFASLAKNQTISYTLDNLILYNKTIGKHDFGVTLLQSQTQYHNEESAMSAQNIKNPDNKWNALTTANVTLAGYSSGLTESGLYSYMGRVTYSYDDKYLITASGRSDAASQLAPGHKWSFFPSASLAWRIDREDFLQNINWLNALKLRAGYGVTANASVSPYQTQPPLDQVLYSTSSGVVNSTQLGNVELGWERTTQYNYGIDFGLFNNRISGSLEYYTSKTDDLLFNRSIPPVTGFSSTLQNIGKTKGNGVELTLNTTNVKAKDFEWSSSLSASYQKSTLVELQNGKFDDINNTLFIGQTRGVIYGFENNGVWRPEDAVEMAKFNAAAGSTIFTFGNARPVDQNGDYKIDANNDRVVIGSTEPKYIAGLTNTFNYKNIELSIFVIGRFGYLYNVGGENLSGKTSQRKLDYYTDDNTDAEYQKPIFSAGTGDLYNTIFGYKNGSFLKIRNISLGYNFDKDFVEKIGLSRLRIYAQAANPGMIFSKVKWTDLDTRTTYSNRGMTLGLNVQF
ncbi:TonB-linked outer membrane protein, SusC/RagA family [Flavobacterium glycines]|uniref:SusC/RagA family protein n=2 Tax=Flavobacterium glycines TaxID=551990 RepID=A0A1B9DMU8_9FLAO|nr:TonB-dependent receptor [Flavobacterium glycines]OCB70989.1 SusC/RagA family protein [Flavobacterium glycines]SDI53904.1 TonB-linked outer membrane protein, SusC/RagA family [Flavobacterium glycines]